MNVQINSSMQPKLMYIYLNGWWLEFVANASRMKYCSICAVVSHTVPRIYPQMHGCTWPAAGWEWKSHLMRRYLCGHFSCYYWRKICALAAGRQFAMRIFFSIHLFICLRSWMALKECEMQPTDKWTTKQQIREEAAACCRAKKQTNKNCQIYIDGFVVWAAAVVHEHHIA